MNEVEILGYVATGAMLSIPVPQIIKNYKTKSTHDLSLTFLTIPVIVSILWGSYGYMIDEPIVFMSNSIMVFMSMTNLCQKLYYDNRLRKSLKKVNQGS